MSTWKVSLLRDTIGAGHDVAVWSETIEDSRSGAHDLILAACEKQGIKPMIGERFRIEEVAKPREYSTIKVPAPDGGSEHWPRWHYRFAQIR